MRPPRKASPEAQEQADMVELMGYPAFRRFLLRVAVAGDMWNPTGGSDERHLRNAEGRRSLGFDIFLWAEESLGVQHPSALPFNVMAQVLQEAKTQGAPNDQSQDDQSDEPADRRL